MNEKGIELKISEDKYQATISIKKNSVSLESEIQILNLLKNKGIVYGVNKEAVNEIIKRNKESGTSPENMIIAEGVRPFKGVKPKIELNFEINTKPKENESGQIDYREISSFIKVKEGDLLAKKESLRNL